MDLLKFIEIIDSLLIVDDVMMQGFEIKVSAADQTGKASSQPPSSCDCVASHRLVLAWEECKAIRNIESMDSILTEHDVTM